MPPFQKSALKLVRPLDEKVDLEGRLKMDHVETAVRSQSLFHRLPADVEFALEEFIEPICNR